MKRSEDVSLQGRIHAYLPNRVPFLKTSCFSMFQIKMVKCAGLITTDPIAWRVMATKSHFMHTKQGHLCSDLT